ncbi:putative serine/threonine-protein kinase, partial [Trifolium medium]|nr:putative serine/threonine-protein kinase [Trifolium medium]
TSIGVRNAPLTNKSDTPLPTQSSQQVLPTSPDAYETDQLTNGDQMTQSAEISPQYAVHHGLHPSHNPVVGEAPISMAPHLLNNQPAILNEDHPPSGVQIQKSELSTSQVETIRDNSGKQGSDHGNILSLETPAPSPSQPFDDY